MPVNRLRVMLCIDSLSLGGAAKNVVRFACNLSPSLFEVSVIAWESGGHFTNSLRDHGITTDVLDRNSQVLAALIQKRRVQIFHIHRGGWAEPNIITIAKAAGVPCILETNIFGIKDHSEENRMIDLTLFKSKTDWLKYVLQNGVECLQWAERWNYLYNPVELQQIESLCLSWEQRKNMRQAMGFDETDEIVGRIGRDDEQQFRKPQQYCS